MGVLSGPSQKPTFFGVLASSFTQWRFKIGVWGFNCSHQKKQSAASGIPARWLLSQINYTLNVLLCTKGSYLIMPKVKLCSIPSGALLKRYQKSGFHTDCYVIDVPACVSQEQFVLAFYSTKLFKLERYILKWVVSRPSTEGQLARFASGEASEFAAWSVEDKSENQLLLSDFQGRTRSWLMTNNIETKVSDYTKLYFGSAVVPVSNKKTGEQRLGFAYRALLGFHKFYSVALLSAAAAKLVKES